MERFRKFLELEINLNNVKNTGQLGAYGITCTYLSDPPEDFDEMEFRTGFCGQEDLVITVVTEMGKIKRVLFSSADQENPDVVRSLTGSQLEELLSKQGEKLSDFLNFITQNEQ